MTQISLFDLIKKPNETIDISIGMHVFEVVYGEIRGCTIESKYEVHKTSLREGSYNYTALQDISTPSNHSYTTLSSRGYNKRWFSNYEDALNAANAFFEENKKYIINPAEKTVIESCFCKHTFINSDNVEIISINGYAVFDDGTVFIDGGSIYNHISLIDSTDFKDYKKKLLNTIKTNPDYEQVEGYKVPSMLLYACDKDDNWLYSEKGYRGISFGNNAFHIA